VTGPHLAEDCDWNLPKLKNPEEYLRALLSDASWEMGQAIEWALEEIATWRDMWEVANARAVRTGSRQADVAAFHRRFGVPMPAKPGWPPQERMDLRVKLIAEEFCEFLRDAGYEGNLWVGRFNEETEQPDEIFDWYHEPQTEDTIGWRDFPKTADALIDLEYVILGTHIEMGVDSDPLWSEVQRANMEKQGGPMRDDGKVLKPAGWKAPDIAGKLREQGWEGE
jgi:predicted HAD superfamily Cof-like phosphohydrolase